MKYLIIATVFIVTNTVIIGNYVYKKKKKEKETRIIEFNKNILGINKDQIQTILGDGTILSEHSLLYLGEWEGVGRTQNIYILDKNNNIEEIVLNIKNIDMKNEIIKRLYKILGYPYLFNIDNEIDKGKVKWIKNGTIYNFQDFGDILELSIKQV